MVLRVRKGLVLFFCLKSSHDDLYTVSLLFGSSVDPLHNNHCMKHNSTRGSFHPSALSGAQWSVYRYLLNEGWCCACTQISFAHCVQMRPDACAWSHARRRSQLKQRHRTVDIGSQHRELMWSLRLIQSEWKKVLPHWAFMQHYAEYSLAAMSERKKSSLSLKLGQN